MARRIQLRRDTEAAWEAANPVLAQGEIGIDLSAKKIKIGDGTTAWNSLAYWDDQETVLTGYATETYVDEAIGAIVIPADLGDLTDANGLLHPKDQLIAGSTDELELTLDNSGTLTTPLLLPRTFTAVLDSDHFATQPGRGLTDTPWQFTVEFAVNPDGTVQTQMDDPTYATNPGYIVGDTFRFTEADHGIPGYNFDLLLSFAVDGGSGLYSTQVSVSPPPEYPSTVSSLGAIKLTADANSLVFGTDGNITVPGDIVPDTDNAYDLGSPTKQWRHVYTAGGSIYLDNIKLTNVNGKFTAKKVINPGEENEAEDPEDSDAVSEIRGSGGSGLGTITIPAESGTTYKGLQVAYGMVHSNGSIDELNVNKIVIHKPVVAAVTIDPNGAEDDFQVSGLTNSDVLAMFVVYGDVNGPKSLATLQAFAEAAIDNVILTEGLEGVYNTVDEMKALFYSNYATLAAAAGGLYTNFDFYNVNRYFNVTGFTLIQGSGATFDITGSGTDYTITPATAGTDYQVGHKILILGTDIGQSDGRWDLILTVSSIDEGGGVTAATWELANPGFYATGSWTGVSGENYNRGFGLQIYDLFYDLTTDTISLSSWSNGSGYVAGDRVRIPGDNILDANNNPLVSPDNDLTLTVDSVNINGAIVASTLTGTVPRPAEVWPDNFIGDGGADQYDDANYISTDLANDISYNAGETVLDGTAAFGEGSTYSFVYGTAIFGLFVTGNSAALIRTSGNSGADGSSTTEAGHIYGPDTVEQTFDNAVTHINLVGDTWAGPIVSFTHTDNGDEVDILISDEGDGSGVGITRSSNQGVYNPYREGSWDSDVSPGGTLWNIDGWADLSDVETRTYTPLYEAFGFGGLGNKIVGTECVMYLPDNGKYYAVKFDQWTQGGGGGFAYTRREIDLNNLQEGIRFNDGTILKSAEGLGRVKLESPGNRRIEEVYGYKSVSVTARDRQEITGATYTNVNAYELRVKKSTEIDAFISPYYNSPTTAVWYISFDNVTFREATINSDGGDNWMFYYVNANNPTVQVEDAPFYIRRDVGGDPVAWWDAADLPGGSSNFRGAIIKYHAYITDSGTMIGTIHIAKDSGDENIFHTEVLSGGTDGENAVLWYQDNENQIKYKRIDGESSTAKIQWTATVFYGEEFWD